MGFADSSTDPASLFHLTKAAYHPRANYPRRVFR
jgi:hypothetical protein